MNVIIDFWQNMNCTSPAAMSESYYPLSLCFFREPSPENLALAIGFFPFLFLEISLWTAFWILVAYALVCLLVLTLSFLRDLLGVLGALIVFCWTTFHMERIIQRVEEAEIDHD